MHPRVRSVAEGASRHPHFGALRYRLVHDGPAYPLVRRSPPIVRPRRPVTRTDTSTNPSRDAPCRTCSSDEITSQVCENRTHQLPRKSPRYSPTGMSRRSARDAHRNDYPSPSVVGISARCDVLRHPTHLDATLHPVNHFARMFPRHPHCLVCHRRGIVFRDCSRHISHRCAFSVVFHAWIPCHSLHRLPVQEGGTYHVNLMYYVLVIINLGQALC